MGNRPFLLHSPGIKSSEVEMAEGNQTASYELLTELTQSAIAQALERHRRLGQSIAVWRDGKVVILEADQIPLPQLDPRVDGSRRVEP
jgi:hypothetical protein